MTARRRGRPRELYRWWQVREKVWCARGGHDCYAGEWMRTRREDYRQLHSCAACLAKEGVTMPPPAPPRPFTFNRDVRQDVRTRQTGDDE